MPFPSSTGPPRLLGAHPVFTSSDVDQARDLVGRIFCAHGLQQARAAQPLDCHMHRVGVNGLSLNYLAYGAEVRITPGCLQDFYLVQIPLAGQAEIRYGHQQALSDVSTAVVLSPDEPVDMRWHAGCAQLMLHIPRSLMRQRLEQAGDHREAELGYELAMAQADGPAAGWCRAVLDLARNIDANGAAWLRHAAAAAAMEDFLLRGLFSLQPHSCSALLQSPPEAALPRHVQRAREFIEAHAEQALTLGDIARAACVSERALQEGFRRHLGTTPHACLREVRLQRVHARLCAAAASGERISVFEEAYRFGFFHLGRFAAYYRQRFGESPSATLARLDAASQQQLAANG